MSSPSPQVLGPDGNEPDFTPLLNRALLCPAPQALSLKQLQQLCDGMVSLVESLHPRVCELQRKSDLYIETKTDGSRVTEADRWVSDQLTTVLPQIAPEVLIAPVQSEEALVPYHERRHWKQFWIIDPIDGTESFIRGKDTFAISVALIEEHRPIVAAISLPTRNQVYFAVCGGGAFRKDSGGVHNLSALERNQTRQVTVEALPPESLPEKLVVAYLEGRGVTGPQVTVESGAACFKFTQLLDGVFDIMPRPYPTHEWDLAAGDLLLREAGFSFVDATTGRLVEYNSSSYEMLVGGFFADRL